MLQHLRPLHRRAVDARPSAVAEAESDDDFVRIDRFASSSQTSPALSRPASRQAWPEPPLQLTNPLSCTPHMHIARTLPKAAQSPVAFYIDARMAIFDPTRAWRQQQLARYDRVMLPPARLSWQEGQAARCGLTDTPLTSLTTAVLIRHHDDRWIYDEAAFMRWWVAFGTYPKTNRRIALMGLYRPIIVLRPAHA